MNGPDSAPWLAFQGLGHTRGLLCAFFTACALCIWELFARAKIYCRIQSSPGFALPGGWKYQGGKRKERIKKVLDCFSSANCSLRRVIVVKKHTHKYSDSSLTKDQDIGIYSSVSSSQACLLISGSSTSANVFCFIESQTSGGVTGPKRVK